MTGVTDRIVSGKVTLGRVFTFSHLLGQRALPSPCSRHKRQANTTQTGMVIADKTSAAH